ncbi:MAG: ornithine carbamoyltransferase [Actinomycetes bacterium]
MSRQFISIYETSHADLARIYELALAPVRGDELANVGVSLVFERPSLRTRASSISAVQRLGGNVAVFTKDEIGLDERESAEDVARTLAQTSSIVAARVRNHDVFARMINASPATSFINLLSNETHPTQAVADVLTLAGHFGAGDLASLRGVTVAYVGDATNVTRSLATALIGLGAHVVVGAPDGYQLSESAVALISSRSQLDGTIRVTDSAHEAVLGARAIYTDSWISMGLEAESAQRRRDLASFQVNAELVATADSPAILHCLPAHRGEEITDEVLDSEQSLVWEEVRHRTSAMLGVLRWMKESQ